MFIKIELFYQFLTHFDTIDFFLWEGWYIKLHWFVQVEFAQLPLLSNCCHGDGLTDTGNPKNCLRRHLNSVLYVCIS